MNLPEQIAQWLCARPKRPFLLAAHIRPDGDAAGSVFGLAFALRDAGFEADILMPEGVPDNYEEFLPAEGILTDGATVDWSRYQALIVLDTSNPERVALGSISLSALPLQVIVIDHHADNKRYGTQNFVMEAPACAYIVFHALRCAGFFISKDAANALLAGMIRDTGCFRFANTTPEAMRTAADLMELGAEYQRLIQTLYFSRPLHEIRGETDLMLNHLSFFDRETIGVLYADPTVLARYELDIRNTDALIDQVRAIRGVEIVALILQLKNGDWKISLRAKCANRPVASAARELGGGGHDMAASAVFSAASMEDARDRLLSILIK